MKPQTLFSLSVPSGQIADVAVFLKIRLEKVANVSKKRKNCVLPK